MNAVIDGIAMSKPTFDPTVPTGAAGETLSAYQDGQVIYAQGDPADAVFYLVEGSVKRMAVSGDENEAAVVLVRPGEFFGERCLAGEAHRVSSATAMAECRVARLEKSALLENSALVGVLLKHAAAAGKQARPTIPFLPSLLDSIPDAVVVTDKDGRIIFVNPAVERCFGYSRDQLIGQDVEILVPQKVHNAHKTHRANYMANPVPRQMGAGLTLHAVRANGTEFPVAVSLGFADTESGQIVIATIEDLTEHQRRERMKDEFIATVTHELRTPLTSIKGSLDLLAGGGAGALPDPATHLIKVASKNCERLTSIVNEILDYAKIESGEMAFDVKPIDVRALIEREIEAVQGFAVQHGVRVRLDHRATHGTVQADAGGLARVISNLLSNAIKYSPREAEVVVGIETRQSMVRISVRDHGRGIPDELKNRIFDKFVQAEGNDARAKGGTGLGLSIVRGIVEQLGGEVGFETAPGGGTIFYVTLPS